MKKYLLLCSILVFSYHTYASKNQKVHSLQIAITQDNLDVQIEMKNMMENKFNTEVHKDDENNQKKSINAQYFLDTQVCTICTDVPTSEKAYMTKCKHVFCSDCLFEWLKTKQTCPNCRISLAQDNELPKTNESIMQLRMSENRIPTIDESVPLLPRNLNIFFHILQWSVVSMYLYRIINHSFDFLFVDIFGFVLFTLSQFQFWYVEYSEVIHDKKIRESDAKIAMTYSALRFVTFVLAFTNIVASYASQSLSMAIEIIAFFYELIITLFFSGFEILFRNRIN